MMEGRSESFRKRFLVMHFFNPVRYMKLLELVTGPDTDPAVFERVRKFGVDTLGKGIVVGKDTPNFVGNRIGAHAMMTTIHLMLEDGLSPEDVDAITGAAMAHPKSASFRTADMVGLDTFVHVADNCHAALPNDEERHVFEVPAYIRAMVGKKLLGNKTKSGFYRKAKAGGSETFDPTTGEYRAKGGSVVAAEAPGVVTLQDSSGRLAFVSEAQTHPRTGDLWLGTHHNPTPLSILRRNLFHAGLDAALASVAPRDDVVSKAKATEPVPKAAVPRSAALAPSSFPHERGAGGGMVLGEGFRNFARLVRKILQGPLRFVNAVFSLCFPPLRV
jgi:hypothetical protein